MKSPVSHRALSLVFVLLLTAALHAQVPALINYQGRVAVGNINFDGTGQFKFALVNANGSITYWTNDGSPLTGQPPALAVSLAVSKGLYSVLLGDSSLGASMTALPPAIFSNPDVRLRVWFNDGVNGFQLLTPDQRLAPTAYLADGVVRAAGLADGSITGAKLAPGSIGTAHLADNAVTAAKVFTAPDWARFTGTVTIPHPVPAHGGLGSSGAAVGSDKVIIGAASADAGGESVGAAYLFNLQGGLLATFNNPTPAAHDVFGSVVAAVGPDKVLITAPRGVFGTPAAPGKAHLFNLQGTLLRTFTKPGSAPNDLFGIAATAVGADKVLISGGSGGTAAVYLFDLAGNLLRTFNDPSPASNPDFAPNEFGKSITAVGADKVLIGASGFSNPGVLTGRAYLFNLSGTLLRTFDNPTPAAFERFGVSLAAIGADKVLIGATGDSVGQSSSGTAYLFDLNGILLRSVNSPAPGFQNGFGAAILPVGSTQALIGDHRGSVFLLDLGTTSVAPIAALADPSLGGLLAAVGADKLLVQSKLNPGAEVFLLTRGSYAPGLATDGVRSGSVIAGSLADGAVLRDNIASDSITGAQIANFGIGSDDIGLSAVKGIHIENGAITSGELADGAVTSSKIPASTINSSHLAAGSVGSSDLASSLTISNLTISNLSLASGAVSGTLSFGSVTRQMINLWSTQYAIGVQGGTFYQRSADNFAWYRGGTHNDAVLNPGGGNTLMTLVPSANPAQRGRLSVGVLEITGGADLAEPFPMSQRNVPAGAVVSIDPQHPGKLKMSANAYDRKVAGIVSGANGIQPGISMIDEQQLEAGENVALSGRVHVKANTSAGPIEPGDLLTTSDVPGEAMRAADHHRAQGSILGKAMTSLDETTGTVLVLVTLQ